MENAKRSFLIWFLEMISIKLCCFFLWGVPWGLTSVIKRYIPWRQILDSVKLKPGDWEINPTSGWVLCLSQPDLHRRGSWQLCLPKFIGMGNTFGSGWHLLCHVLYIDFGPSWKVCCLFVCSVLSSYFFGPSMGGMAIFNLHKMQGV